MKQQRIILWIARIFLAVSALSMIMVSLMAFRSPQAVMDLVHVQLNNTDAFSSIRGVYGGVGLTLFVTIVYMLIKNVQKGLWFLALLWGMYAVSRIITIYAEGSLGAFGSQWLKIETLFCVIALTLSILYKPMAGKQTA